MDILTKVFKTHVKMLKFVAYLSFTVQQMQITTESSETNFYSLQQEIHLRVLKQRKVIIWEPFSF